MTGTNNAYIMLVDDTSFAANAFSLEISNTMLSEDKTDEKVGTHFKSNTYQKYVARFKEHGGTVSAFNLVALTNAIQMKALPDGDPAKVGNMFIIGMGRNYVKFRTWRLGQRDGLYPQRHVFQRIVGSFQLNPDRKLGQ